MSEESFNVCFGEVRSMPAALDARPAAYECSCKTDHVVRGSMV